MRQHATPTTTPTIPAKPPTAFTGRFCVYCGKPAEVFGIGGPWCTEECRRFDLGSDSNLLRHSRASDSELLRPYRGAA